MEKNPNSTRGLGSDLSHFRLIQISMEKKKVLIADEKPRPRRLRLEAYTHISGYHACRPVDVAKYHTKGISLYDEKDMQRAAIELFGISADEVVADRLLPYHSRIYFCIFKQQLVREAGHYLCYGSEYLAGIASRLDRYIAGPYHNNLLCTGIPTIFICDVPIELISESLINDLSCHYRPGSLDWSVWITQSLPPECIVAHEHPRKFFDSLRRYFRVNEQVSCSVCE